MKNQSIFVLVSFGLTVRLGILHGFNVQISSTHGPATWQIGERFEVVTLYFVLPKIHPPQSKKGLNAQNDIATWTISGWCYTILLGYILLNRPHAYICWSFVIDHDGQV